MTFQALDTSYSSDNLQLLSPKMKLKICQLLMAGNALAAVYYIFSGDFGCAAYYGCSAAATLGFFLAH